MESNNNANANISMPITTTSTTADHLKQQRMFRFLHCALAIVSLIWAPICLMLYFHTPYQAQQVFDCRWYLSALIIQAALGHAFVFYSQTTFLFIAAFVATQYSVVYSLLTLVVYGLDTVMFMVSPRTFAISHVPYLKLAAVLIVLSCFGFGLSLVHMHRLLQHGRQLGLTNSIAVGNIRQLRVVTGAQIIMACLSIYVAASLLTMRFWYVRVHLVQEISCSLLALTLAVIQFIIFHNNNVNGSGHFLIKAIALANACQLVQEVNMALSAFYTHFYVDRVYKAIEFAEQFDNDWQDPQMQLLVGRVQRAKLTLALNVLLHLGRMALNGYVLFMLAGQAFSEALALRVKFKVDTELVNAEECWERRRQKEKKWLYSIACCVAAVGVGHVLLNFGYIWASLIFESLSVSTGLSFVFSLALLISIGFYTFRLQRFLLILSAYISLNLLITATLLLFAFVQDFFFLATALDDADEKELLNITTTEEMMRNDTTNGSTLVHKEAVSAAENSSVRILLYFFDFGLSLGTLLVAGSTMRYSIRTLLGTKNLQTQSSSVQKAVRFLRALSLVGLVFAVLEMFMLAESRFEGSEKIGGHSSNNTSFYDWLLSASQFLFLFYVTRYERFQALLPVQILQLASVSLTTLDLIGQQTETVQAYINNVLQFYRVAEALQRQAQAQTSGGTGTVSNSIFIAQPVAFSLFVDILALHFIQIVQWFLTIAALVLSLYIYDNMEEHEQDRTNDFHELRSTGTTNPPPLEQGGIAASQQGNQANSTTATNMPNGKPVPAATTIATAQPPRGNNNNNNGGGGGNGMMSFDNNVFLRFGQLQQEEEEEAENAMESSNGKKGNVKKMMSFDE